MSKKDVHTVPNAGGKGWVNKVGGEVQSRHRTRENASVSTYIKCDRVWLGPARG